MIYNLTDLISLNIAKLLLFLIFCLSDFNNICKSNVDTVSKTILAFYHNKISSPHSPDYKKPNLRRLLLKFRRATVAKLKKGTCPEF